MSPQPHRQCAAFVDTKFLEVVRPPVLVGPHLSLREDAWIEGAVTSARPGTSRRIPALCCHHSLRTPSTVDLYSVTRGRRVRRSTVVKLVRRHPRAPVWTHLARPVGHGLPMPPNIVGDQTMEALRRAVTPSSADISVAKASVRARLSDAAVSTQELIDEALSSLGIAPPAHREVYDIRPELEPNDAVDPDAQQLRRLRMTHAIKLALAELTAEGVIVPAETPHNDRIPIEVHRAGTSGAEHVPVSTPRVADAYRAKPRIGALGDAPALSAAEFADGLGSLLTPRALECLSEALTAYRHGLYLSAVNLLGAVSEAAWYEIGAQLQDESPDLASALARNSTGELQRMVANQYDERKGRARSMANELIAHASYLRDLRNYGVHPSEDQDPGQADAFTEVGCTVLVMQTHRYLARLREAGAHLGLTFE
jgi:hypothetical protein